MKRIYTLLAFLFLNISCGQSQNQVTPERRLVGGPCEGCEAIFEYGTKTITPTDTLPDFHKGKTKLKVTGTVFQQDGKTPAQGVILYIYHTDERGVYPKKGDEKGWAKRHGYIRGWTKTDKNGKYTFYTFKPGSYPSRTDPAHIHLTILEPNGKYYWADDYNFADDPLLKPEPGRKTRGGHSGILTLQKDGDLLVGNRDIILGRNVMPYE